MNSRPGPFTDRLLDARRDREDDPAVARPPAHRAHARRGGRHPAVYVQARAGHAQATMTERYVHAAQVAFRSGEGGGQRF